MSDSGISSLENSGSFSDYCPEFFLNFLKKNDIDIKVYERDERKNLRFVWLNLQRANEETLMAEFVDSKKLNFFDDIYSIPGEESLSNSRLCREGALLGIDPSSALAVANLSLQPKEDLLDLCCAPGSKLILCAQKICPILENNSPTRGSVTGVDVSRARLSVAVSLVKRFGVGRCRLFVGDGKLFDIGPINVHDPRYTVGMHMESLETDYKDRNFFTERVGYCPIEPPSSGKMDDLGRFSHNTGDTEKNIKVKDIQNEMNNYACKILYSSTDYRRMPTSMKSPTYDKVLVDAPCTHDGSIKHVRKMIGLIKKDKKMREEIELLYSENNLEDLYKDQFGLLAQGFSLVKRDGILVYSTCSLAKRQNEDVIINFLNHFGSSKVQIEDPIGPEEWKFSFIDRNGGKHTALRVFPGYGFGGGFFVCRIRRIS